MYTVGQQDAYRFARGEEITTTHGLKARLSRWTAYEVKRFNIDMPEEVPMTTQERAYTSPIWYTP